jgi:hypothetical protein
MSAKTQGRHELWPWRGVGLAVVLALLAMPVLTTCARGDSDCGPVGFLTEEILDIDVDLADDLTEASGRSVVALLLLGNAWVVFGLWLRAAARVGLVAARPLVWLTHLYRVPGKYQTPVHCTLNLLALATACLHLVAVDEQGSVLLLAALGLMAMLGASGLLLVAKPRLGLRRAASRFHRHPVTLGVLALLIVVGHWAAD